MRSRAIQSLLPLRTPSSSLQCLLRPASGAAPSSSSRSSRTPSSLRVQPASTWQPRRRSAATAATTTRTSTLKPPSDASDGQIDAQAAIPAAPHVSEIDPSLAAQIPTATSSSRPGVAAAFHPAPSSTSSGVTNPGSENGNGNGNGDPINWTSSFHGLATNPFPPETAAVLMRDLDPRDVEIKPDGVVYLPEIKYRRILNQAFGPGGWGLAPRGELVIADKLVTREYALVVQGRFIAEARGECAYFSEETIPTAGEGCKSNALMRCCKDLGIASELWDPRYIRQFKKEHAEEVWVEHVVNKKRRQIWKLKDADIAYPYTAVKKTATAAR